MLKILVICTANICRSPMGELLLRDALSGQAVQVDSAGIHGQHGMPADETVARLLKEIGVEDIDQHASKPVVSGMIPQYDLFLCMEKHHLEDLQSISPNVTGRAYLFGHWSNLEIADPHRLTEDHYRRAMAQIQEASDAWCQKLPMLGLF